MTTQEVREQVVEAWSKRPHVTITINRWSFALIMFVVGLVFMPFSQDLSLGAFVVGGLAVLTAFADNEPDKPWWRR
jgi:hypothetical protein